MRLLPLAPALLICLGTSSACQNNNGRHHLTVDGRTRTYLLERPPQLQEDESTPLVIALHDDGTDGAIFATQTQFSKLAQDLGNATFTAVYPDGLGDIVHGKTLGTWSAEGCCGFSAQKQIDDVGFIAAVLDDVIQNNAIDPNRIYITGKGTGARLAAVVGCRLRNRVAALAMVGESAFPAACDGVNVPGVLIMTGTADPCVPSMGGEHCGGCVAEPLQETFGADSGLNQTFTCNDVDTNYAQWTNQAQCTLAPAAVFDGEGTLCVSSGGCFGGVEIAHCTVQGGGHTWPGGEQGCSLERSLCRNLGEALGKQVIGPDAGQIIWTFFERFSL